jgi:hypothetical protein
MLGLGKTILSAVVGHIHCQFKPTPDSRLVKCTAQMILDHLFADAADRANFAIPIFGDGIRPNPWPSLGLFLELQSRVWRIANVPSTGRSEDHTGR